jgi:hypothetical protein
MPVLSLGNLSQSAYRNRAYEKTNANVDAEADANASD